MNATDVVRRRSVALRTHGAGDCLLRKHRVPWVVQSGQSQELAGEQTERGLAAVTAGVETGV